MTNQHLLKTPAKIICHHSLDENASNHEASKMCHIFLNLILKLVVLINVYKITVFPNKILWYAGIFFILKINFRNVKNKKKLQKARN